MADAHAEARFRVFLRREGVVIRGLASDEGRAFFEPFVIEIGPMRGRPPKDRRRVPNGMFRIARAGAPH